jgi:hypothetical protein
MCLTSSPNAFSEDDPTDEVNFDIGRRENHQTLGRFDSRQQPHSLMLGALKFPTTINRGPLR